MTMTPSQVLRAPRIPAGSSAREGYGLSASHPFRDFVTDPPILEAVGHPVAVSPDPEDDEPTGDRPDHSAATAA
jgi:hypothetical protein